jgi:hypothetical protein
MIVVCTVHEAPNPRFRPAEMQDSEIDSSIAVIARPDVRGTTVTNLRKFSFSCKGCAQSFAFCSTNRCILQSES